VSAQLQSTAPDPRLHGLLAEFEEVEQLVAAARRAREAGYRKLDAYTPFPVEDLEEALGLSRSRVPLLVLIGGLCGGFGGWFLQYWSQVLHYPLNVAGRPHNSWPAFVVPTFECTILFAAIAGVLGMLVLNKFPMPYHPVFNVERFARASADRYFLCIEAEDPRFDRHATEDFLRGLGPAEVSEVER
jgi:Alternative complex III, ActD subunit